MPVEAERVQHRECGVRRRSGHESRRTECGVRGDARASERHECEDDQEGDRSRNGQPGLAQYPAGTDDHDAGHECSRGQSSMPVPTAAIA